MKAHITEIDSRYKSSNEETQELNFQVNGEFSQEEADDLTMFINQRIIGKHVNYEYVVEKYCKSKGYDLEVSGKNIKITKKN